MSAMYDIRCHNQPKNEARKLSAKCSRVASRASWALNSEESRPPESQPHQANARDPCVPLVVFDL